MDRMKFLTQKLGFHVQNAWKKNQRVKAISQRVRPSDFFADKTIAKIAHVPQASRSDDGRTGNGRDRAAGCLQRGSFAWGVCKRGLRSTSVDACSRCVGLGDRYEVYMGEPKKKKVMHKESGNDLFAATIIATEIAHHRGHCPFPLTLVRGK